jgi:hypothetical protein
MCAHSWSFKWISLATAAETFNILILQSLIRTHLHEIWGRDAVCMIRGYRNQFKADITLQHHIMLAIFTPECYDPQLMNQLLLDCSVEGTPDGETHRQLPQVICGHMGDI